MNRAVRENVALNHDLDQLLKTNRELEAINVERKRTEQMLRLKCELFESESQITLNKTLKQRDAIHQVVKEFQSLIAYYGQVERSNARLRDLQSILEDLMKRKEQTFDKESKRYEENILAAREENKRLVETIHERERQLEILKSVFNNTSTFLTEALQIAEEAYNNRQCIGCMGPKMLHSLMEILQTDTITSAVDYTASEIDEISCKYTMGCLGLVMPPKDKEDVAKRKEEDMEEEAREEESLNSLERIPSCLLSEISSSIPSPKEP